MPNFNISAGLLKVHAFLLILFLLAYESLDALLLECVEVPQYDLGCGIVDPASVRCLCY